MSVALSCLRYSTNLSRPDASYTTSVDANRCPGLVEIPRAEAAVTVSSDGDIQELLRQRRVMSIVFVVVGPVLGLFLLVISLARGQPKEILLAVLWSLIISALGFNLCWFLRNLGVESMRLSGRFQDFSSPVPRSPFSSSRGLLNTVTTADGCTYQRVRISNGYVLRVGTSTRIPFDPKNVVDIT